MEEGKKVVRDEGEGPAEGRADARAAGAAVFLRHIRSSFNTGAVNRKGHGSGGEEGAGRGRRKVEY